MTWSLLIWDCWFPRALGIVFFTSIARKTLSRAVVETYAFSQASFFEHVEPSHLLLLLSPSPPRLKNLKNIHYTWGYDYIFKKIPIMAPSHPHNSFLIFKIFIVTFNPTSFEKNFSKYSTSLKKNLTYKYFVCKFQTSWATSLSPLQMEYFEF